MSSGFQEREEGNEAKLKHDGEVHFRIQARRDKLLGEWAAGQMGLEGEAAESYPIDLVKADIREPGDEDVLDKLKADFAAHGVDVSEEMICQKMAELESIATDQVHGEGYGTDD